MHLSVVCLDVDGLDAALQLPLHPLVHLIGPCTAPGRGRGETGGRENLAETGLVNNGRSVRWDDDEEVMLRHGAEPRPRIDPETVRVREEPLPAVCMPAAVSLVRSGTSAGGRQARKLRIKRWTVLRQEPGYAEAFLMQAHNGRGRGSRGARGAIHSLCRVYGTPNRGSACLLRSPTVDPTPVGRSSITPQS